MADCSLDKPNCSNRACPGNCHLTLCRECRPRIRVPISPAFSNPAAKETNDRAKREFRMVSKPTRERRAHQTACSGHRWSYRR
jgi:hypothetical protein